MDFLQSEIFLRYSPSVAEMCHNFEGNNNFFIYLWSYVPWTCPFCLEFMLAEGVSVNSESIALNSSRVRVSFSSSMSTNLSIYMVLSFSAPHRHFVLLDPLNAHGPISDIPNIVTICSGYEQYKAKI
ncbi:hypothetical protein K7X08_003564 [Anisodus acutangulus]|uniref:Uncharacterized protein n=1 Tax=Anisodus acutangulus TaxID=402998 RepID=A0A9Q1MIR8_9SOLA|nr:hypothetical protein K7X08_003564 [Anisodus acutangulus]